MLVKLNAKGIKGFYIFSVVFVMCLKIFWSNTREIFISGPDADTYIAMASDLVNKGFFSDGLTGVPIWSQGYPTVLAILLYLFGEKYVFVAQLIQILMYAGAVETFRRISVNSRLLSRNLSFVFAVALTFQPSSFFYTQQAMYESFFLFFLSMFLYGILKESRQEYTNVSQFSSGFALFFLLCVHERALPIVILALFIFWNRIKIPFVIGAITSLPVALSMLFRNGIFYETWRLTGAGDGVSTGITELLRGNWDNFWNNLFYFWSSYHGYGKRGTWFHNATLDFVADNFVSSELIMWVSFVFSGILVCVTFLGLYNISRENLRIGLMLFGIFISTNLVDGLTYGDSRHRLVLSPLILLCILKFLLMKSSKQRFQGNQVI